MKKIVILSLIAALSLQAESFSKVTYLKVKNSIPVYEDIVEYIPVESCENVKEDTGTRGQGSNILGTLVGGVLGGVVGNQFGGGSGKTVATVGGAIAGTMAGNHLSKPTENETTYQVVKKCSVKQVAQNKRILSGYKNISYFEGQEISVISENQLKEIPVTITFSY